MRNYNSICIHIDTHNLTNWQLSIQIVGIQNITKCRKNNLKWIVRVNVAVSVGADDALASSGHGHVAQRPRPADPAVAGPRVDASTRVDDPHVI